MAKVKIDGHIWSLAFNRYMCYSFRTNWVILHWDKQNQICPFELRFIYSY